MRTVRIICLTTGEVMDADPAKLAEKGLPVTFRLLDEVSKEELADRLYHALQGCELDEYRYRDQTREEWEAAGRPQWICQGCRGTFVTIPICAGYICPLCSRKEHE